MDDLISRKEAIEAVCRGCSGDFYQECQAYHGRKTFCDQIKRLRAVPSAQPDYKTDHGYMWICPKCGLMVHSDFESCVRCGHERRFNQ